MKIKLDENLPSSLAAALRNVGRDVDAVGDEGLSGAVDDDVWAAAQRDGRFLVTQDLDFSDIRKFTPGTHAGLLLVRVPDVEQWRVGEYVIAWLQGSDVESWRGCFVVGTPAKLRVVRPPSTLESDDGGPSPSDTDGKTT